MRIAIIVLIVLAAVMAVYFVAAGTGHVRIGGFDAPDKDHPDDWNPPPIATGLGDLLAPFAPHARFDVQTVALGPAAQRSLTAAMPTDRNTRMEIARFEVSASGGLGISYSCAHQDGSDCSQVLCLCPPGGIVTPARLALCPQAFRAKVSGSVCSPDAKAKGSLVIYPEARTVTLFNLGPGTVHASIR